MTMDKFVRFYLVWIIVTQTWALHLNGQKWASSFLVAGLFPVIHTALFIDYEILGRHEMDFFGAPFRWLYRYQQSYLDAREDVYKIWRDRNGEYRVTPPATDQNDE